MVNLWEPYLELSRGDIFEPKHVKNPSIKKGA